MMTIADRTLIYYTSSRINEILGENVRKTLIETSYGALPIISVSQKPLDFGNNVLFGDFGIHVWNLYYQIMMGVERATTRWVVCCEDDILYPSEHLFYQPKHDDVFYYNTYKWTTNGLVYWWRNRINMSTCIASRELMLKTLRKRFKEYPNKDHPKIRFFSEPGKYEKHLGLPEVKRLKFNTKLPIVGFNHRPSLGGKRRINKTDVITPELPYWGKAKNLWEEYYGNDK
jgi:hypothetical protein